MPQSSIPRLYVNPSSGDDAGSGELQSPLRTLGTALRLVQPSQVIQLAMGFYREGAGGETFPLRVPEGVTLLGDEPTKGRGIVIEGNGTHRSDSLGEQSSTLILGPEVQVRGITITNPIATGIWIEGTGPIVANCTLLNCGREGILLATLATPLLRDNVFQGNRVCGLTLMRNSKGEIWGNICRQMPLGMALGEDSAPLLVKNLISANKRGLVIAGRSRPVLRNNIIENNEEEGISIQGDAEPDLGSPQDPAGNLLRNNTLVDLSNLSGGPIVSVGNQVVPTRIQGVIDFQISQRTTPIAIPESELPTLIKTAYPDLIPVPNPTIPADGFPDVKGHWAEAFIQALIERKAIRGFPDRTFRPDSPLTRAEFASIIAPVFGQSEPPMSQASTPNTLDFPDMAPNFWGRKDILKANRMGFLSGFPDGTFRPNQQLTRVQAIVALVNGLRLTGGTPDVLTVYSDRAQIPSYATQAIATATQNRLLVNYPQLNQLEPLRSITRAEISVMIYQSLIVQRRAPVIDLAYLPQPMLPATLPDVRGHWSEAFVRALVNQNLLKGMPDGLFRPDAVVSRAEFAAFIAQAFNPLSRGPAPSFEDVPIQFWAKGAIEQTVRGGFMAGSSSHRFLPDRPIPRVQALISLVRGLQLRGGEPETLNNFGDVDAVPNYARADLVVALNHRLIISHPDPRQLRPMQEATRAEVAAIIYQGLLSQGRMAALPSAYIVLPG
jgi:parallel beta-helix repeat protein